MNKEEGNDELNGLKEQVRSLQQEMRKIPKRRPYGRHHAQEPLDEEDTEHWQRRGFHNAEDADEGDSYGNEDMMYQAQGDFGSSRRHHRMHPRAPRRASMPMHLIGSASPHSATDGNVDGMMMMNSQMSTGAVASASALPGKLAWETILIMLSQFIIILLLLVLLLRSKPSSSAY